MGGFYRHLLLLFGVMYVVCMLVNQADAAPQEHGGPGRSGSVEKGDEEFDRALRKRRSPQEDQGRGEHIRGRGFGRRINIGL